MLFHATFTPRHCAPTAQEATLGLAKWCENYFKLTRKMKEETFCSSFERYCSWVWGFIQNTQNRPWSFSMNFLLIQATEHLTRNLLLQQTRIPFFGSSRFFTFLKYNLWYFGFRKFDWPWMNLNLFLNCDGDGHGSSPQNKKHVNPPLQCVVSLLKLSPNKNV